MNPIDIIFSSTLYTGMFFTLAWAGALMFILTWLATGPLAKYRIRTPETYRIPASKKAINVGLNSILSLVFFLFVLYYFEDYLVYTAPAASALTIFGEALASLLLYDFFYYFLHRTMHHPKLMKYVHGVHHYARFPTSYESIYLHPAENLAGLALLLGSIALLGPISIAGFLVAFFIHTSANVLVHSNLLLPHPAFRLFNSWAVRHDYHHGKHLNKNYSSIFPFWDQMFGTAV